MSYEVLGFARLTRSELSYRLLRIVSVRRLTAFELQTALGLELHEAEAITRGRTHHFQAEQLRAMLNLLCQRSPERRR